MQIKFWCILAQKMRELADLQLEDRQKEHAERSEQLAQSEQS